MDLKNLESTYLKPCAGKVIASLVGGSTLYGLNTPSSDVDYRGIYIATDNKYKAGFEKMDSVVLSPHNGDNEDATYYEIGHYLRLLQKTNTQVMEMLFALDSSFTYKHPFIDQIRSHRYSLIDSEKLKSSIRGYVQSELRLATGERSGQLGGKRKADVEKYGFSPKNFVQIFRLIRVGIRFFDTGVYMVNVKEHSPTLHAWLMALKTDPSGYTCEELKDNVLHELEALETSIKNSEVNYKFDIDFASDMIISSRKMTYNKEL
jgi:hypothetical protein